METKKIILFLVEGVTDEYSLAPTLKRIINEEEIMFSVIKGDITSNRDSTDKNIIEKIQNKVYEYISNEKLNKSDIIKIIHLVDTDGTYIKEKYFIEDQTFDKGFMYKETFIIAKDICRIKERNERKSSILNVLFETQKIEDIEYIVYYFSCNLEHVLHKEQCLDDKLKVRTAIEFSKRYKNDKEGFINLFNSNKIKVDGDYKETCEFIKEGTNSISRNCNFHLFLEEYKDRN